MTGTWSPSPLHEDDRVTLKAAHALHDLLEVPGAAPRAGDQLPLLWHWLAFPPRARRSELGVDGHPTTGGFLPPTDDRRRMFAGAHVVRSGSLRVEEPLARTSVVGDVTEKSGRSGPLMFVKVDHELHGSAGTVKERVTVVYKGRSETPPVPRPAESTSSGSAVEETWPWARAVPVDPVLLFQFSALTYNAHRIHYDRDHAVGVEGYPGLVVHGPLQALLLVDLVGRVLPGRRVEELSFRSHAPVFDDAPLELRARPRGTGSVELAVLTPLGQPAMSATATLAPAEGGA